MSFLKYVLLAASCLLISCNSIIGPGSLKRERQDFNIALQQTNDEQMLLNLVRMKYRDTTMFLEVTALASQYTIGGSVTVAGSLKDNFSNSIGLGAKLEYQQKPTITYAPLQGQKFITRLLSQVRPETIALLHKSGWSIERLLLVCFERIGRLANAPSASGPTPSYVPRFKEFHQMAQYLRQQQVRGGLDFSLMKSAKGALGFNLSFNEFADAESNAALYGLLKVDSKGDYQFSPNSQDGDKLYFETRSLREMLFFLSQGVEVPQQHIDEGKVTVTKDADGAIFDWASVTGKFMIVKASSSPISPSNSYVAVQYRGQWFYIEDNDLNSKSTFSLLMQLYNLQSGDSKGNGLILTLPIGG